jgi:hypothetical protein
MPKINKVVHLRTLGGDGNDYNGGGNEPPEGGGLEKRVVKLEETSTDIQIRMVRIETRLESIEGNMASHTDIANLKNDLAGLEMRLIKWFVATAFAMTGLAATISFGLARLLQ